MTMWIRTALASVCLALPAVLVGAESAPAPDSAALPSLPTDRTWLLILDLRAIGQSGLAPLLERIDNAPQTQYLEDIGHLQVSRDLAAVVISGSYAPDTGVAYCTGTFDVDGLHQLVEQIPDHAERAWHGHRIDTWQGDNDAKPSWACVVDDRMLLFARSEAQLDHALDALDGVGATLSAHAPLLAALPVRARALASGAAVSLEELPAARRHSLVMKRIDNLALVVEQSPKGLQLEITGATTSEAVAKRLSRLVSGLQAMAQLSVEDTPAHPMMALLVDHAVVSSSGTSVVVTATITPAEVLAAVDARDAHLGSGSGKGIHGASSESHSASSGGVRP